MFYIRVGDNNSRKQDIQLIPFTPSDYTRLDNGQWYSDNVIMHLLKEFLSRHPRFMRLVDSIAFIAKHARMTKLKSSNAFNLIVPYHASNHWCVLFIMVSERQNHQAIDILVMDSLHTESLSPTLIQNTKMYMTKQYDISPEPNAFLFHTISCQQQQIFYDCGVHCVYNIEVILQLLCSLFKGTPVALKKKLAKIMPVQ